jgi:hypothetical protein
MRSYPQSCGDIPLTTLLVELEMTSIEEREKKQGFEDGRGIQARLERAATNGWDVDRREELFERALV